VAKNGIKMEGWQVINRKAKKQEHKEKKAKEVETKKRGKY
jgi:hypothetical protein